MSELPSFPSRRSAVLATRGLVATSQPLAAMAGARMLLAGGNAVDAAIATAAALAVVEPTGCGMGGDAFALLYDGPSGRVSAYDGSGAAPHAADADALVAAGHAAVPRRGALSVTVPGAVDAWATLAASRGTMPLAALLAPAIELAEGGYAVSERIAAGWRASEALLGGDDAARRHLLVDGRAPREGEVMRLPAMGRSLRAIAEGGHAAFYGGPLGNAIATAVAAAGGWLTADDIARHTGRWVEPLGVAFDGVRVWQCPPPGQGLAALIALGIADGWWDGRRAGWRDERTASGAINAGGSAGDDWGDTPGDDAGNARGDSAGDDEGDDGRGVALPEWGSVAHLHPLIEAMRLGFADAAAHVADPDHHSAPIDRLLDPAYLADRRALVRRDRAMAAPTTGVPGPGGTVYLAVVDAAGNACSFIQSNYSGFGSGLVAGETGIPIQNRGAGFVLTPGHPNRLAGDQRPFHTIIPGLATRAADGSLFAVFGVMGGHMQPQGHLQVLSNVVRYRFDAQRALDAPRFQITPPGRIALEDGFDDAVRASLAGLGHDVVARDATPSAGTFGGGQLIVVDEAGVRHGGSDPRKDGCAIAT